MYIYEVFQVVPSTAPMYKGVGSKLTSIAFVEANNSVSACFKAADKYNVPIGVELYAHQRYIV